MLKKLKRTPTEKGRQFEIQKLKENWKTALTNSIKQMNLIIKEKEYKDKTRMNPPPPPIVNYHMSEKNVRAVSERIQALLKVQSQIKAMLTFKGNR